MDEHELAQLVGSLQEIQPEPDFRDDELSIYCLRLALDALEQGNYGVAAVLLNERSEVVAQAENQVFNGSDNPAYNSRGHAEMVLLDQLELQQLDFRPSELTMLVTLEPCPMCLGRILLSGIASVRYICSDPDGGMVGHMDHLPPAWRNLAQQQNHYHAHVSKPVKRLAKEISVSNLHTLRQKLIRHIRH